MRLPRDVSGARLATALAVFGDAVMRQTGSHLRLTTRQNGEHHVTVPNHDALRVGTLSEIIVDVAAHLGLTREQLLQRLFL